MVLELRSAGVEVRKGDLVRVRGMIPMGSDSLQKISRGWRDFPGEYNYHSYVWAPDGLFGVVIEERGTYCRVLLGCEPLWLENDHVERIA